MYHSTHNSRFLTMHYCHIIWPLPFCFKALAWLNLGCCSSKTESVGPEIFITVVVAGDKLLSISLFQLKIKENLNKYFTVGRFRSKEHNFIYRNKLFHLPYISNSWFLWMFFFFFLFFFCFLFFLISPWKDWWCLVFGFLELPHLVLARFFISRHAAILNLQSVVLLFKRWHLKKKVKKDEI